MSSTQSQPPAPSPPAASSAALDRLLLPGLLLVVGTVLLASSLKLLPVGHANVLDWMMLGAGGLLLTSEVMRALLIRSSRISMARIVLGMAFTGLSLTTIFALSATILWPAALVVFGLIILIRSVASNS